MIHQKSNIEVVWVLLLLLTVLFNAVPNVSAQAAAQEPVVQVLPPNAQQVQISPQGVKPNPNQKDDPTVAQAQPVIPVQVQQPPVIVESPPVVVESPPVVVESPPVVESQPQRNVVPDPHPISPAPVVGIIRDGQAAEGPKREVELSDVEYQKHLAKSNGVLEKRPYEQQQNSSDNLIKEWEEQMGDFIPDMIVTFQLAGGAEKSFFQDVGPIPVVLRGGYFESDEPLGEEESLLRFQIVDPKGKVILKMKKGESLFRIETSMGGTYSFIIHNKKWTSKYVTFVIGAGEESALSADAVRSVEGNLQILSRMTGEIESESQYMWTRLRTQMEVVQKIELKTFLSTALALLVVIVMGSFQVFYMKKVSSESLFI